MSTLAQHPPGHASPFKISKFWLMLLVSVALHVAIVVIFVLTTKLNFSIWNQDLTTNDMQISIREAPMSFQNLPPTRGNREAGPTQAAAPRQEEVKEIPQAPEEKKAEPEVKQEPPAKKPEPKKEAEQKPVTQKPKETPPKQKEAEPDVTMVSAKNTGTEKPEEVKPEPTQQEIARETQRTLEARRDVFTKPKQSSGSNQAGYVAYGTGDEGGGGGPSLYRSVLVQTIGELWVPSYVPRGEIRDATVQFTIVSPPLPAGAVNQNRTAMVTEIKINVSSGDLEFDNRALEAVRRVLTWPPLPDSYTKDSLVVFCRFYLIGEE